MTANRPSPMVELGAWLDEVRAELPASGNRALTPEEQTAILDLARVAARTSERISAPLTAFLAGVALAELSSGDRATKLRAVVVGLEPET